MIFLSALQSANKHQHKSFAIKISLVSGTATIISKMFSCKVLVSSPQNYNVRFSAMTAILETEVFGVPTFI